MQCMLIDQFFKSNKPGLSKIVAHEATISNRQVIPDYSKEIRFYGSNADLKWVLEHRLSKGIPAQMEVFDTEEMPYPYSDRDLLICINLDKTDMLASVLSQT